jgi:molecular chaperone GrpE
MASSEASLPLALLPAPTAEELEQLRADAAKAAENWNKLLRATADFENFKKRAVRERQEGIAYANAAILQRLIPVLDNFEMALAAAAGAPDAPAQSLLAGVNMIASQFRAALAESGLEEIDAAGQPFDPNVHEAVSQQESAEVPEGRVLQQLRKGYKLRDRLLRPATVIVAKKPSPPADPAATPADG